jgi:hypothetical protein
MGLVFSLLELGIPPELVRLLVDIDINGTAQVITPVGLSETYRVETVFARGKCYPL